jgi:hypothetical protein
MRTLRQWLRLITAHPAESLGIAVALGQLAFLRSLPILWLLILWIPAALIVYLILRLTIPRILRRFNSIHNHWIELIVSALTLTILYLFLGLPWWSAVLLICIFVFMVLAIADKRPGAFYVIYYGLLIFILFAGAHGILLAEFRTVAWLMDKHETGAMHEEVKDGKWTILRGNNPILEFAILPEMKVSHDVNMEWIPGNALGVLSPGGGISPPGLIPFEMTHKETGEKISFLLGGMNLSGTAESLTPPRRDSLSFSGVELQGLVFGFKNPQSGRLMQIAMYCSSKFDLSFLVIEEVQPGFPHSPLILQQLDQARPGLQTGNPNCVFDNP